MKPKLISFFLAAVIIVLVLYLGYRIWSINEIEKFPDAKQIAVIVNDKDPLSLQISQYYQTVRDIPDENMIHVNFEHGKSFWDVKTFEAVFKEVRNKTPEKIQGYVLTWLKPYRVGCMSITMAFASGYDMDFCPKKAQEIPCKIPKENPFYAQHGVTPWDDYKLRPTMVLAATSFEQAKALIDRGVSSDSSVPKGTAYLLSTSDANRNVRAKSYQDTLSAWYSEKLNIEILKQDYLQDKNDVMFYFTGISRVGYLDTLDFLPGAVADHLTSFGGRMKSADQGGQMSSLRWLEAGATGSYGTIMEPCNFPMKFPDPYIFLDYYLFGESLLFSYWKSVKWPSEGLFIGEPLASPFASKK